MSALASALPSRPSREATGFAALSLALSLGVGLAASRSWFVACLVAAATAAPLVVSSSTVRLYGIVLGGLLLLQSTEGFSRAKLAYLAFVALALAVALWRRTESERLIGRPIRRLSLAALPLVAVACISGLVAETSGTPGTEWARDVAPYLLLGTVPLVVADAAARVGRTALTGLLVVAGGGAALSFAVAWLDRRGLASLPVDRLLFPSTGLATALVCYALARAHAATERRAAWLTVAAVLLALLLVTATRSALVLLVAPLMMALARGSLRDVLRGVVVLALLLALTPLLVHGVGRATGADLGRVTDRLVSVTRIADDPVAAQSLEQRYQQTALAWETFRSAPLLGVGPGHHFVWRDDFGVLHDAFTMDSSVVFAAKFGVAGLAALLVFVVGFARSLAEARPAAVPSDRLAVVGYLAIWVASVPLALPLEDKGFSFGLVLLLALFFNRRRPR